MLVQQIFSSYNSIRSHRSSIIDIELLKQPIPKNYSLNKIELLNLKTYKTERCFDKYFDTAPWIFQNINIEIPKGSKVGFIGKTGSGKSTFLDITMGLIDPTKGCLKIDETKITQYNNNSWHKLSLMCLKIFTWQILQ